MFRKKPSQPSLPPEWLIVGLGNPGPEYAYTRHNVGFEVIDELARESGVKLNTRQHRAVYGPAMLGSTPVLLAKPMTFMNLSGQAIGPILRSAGLKPDRLLVITDDLDLPPGKVRLREKGSAGGHNGHRSIIQTLGTQEYARLKIGVGKVDREDTVGHVLSKFTPSERTLINEAIERSVMAVQLLLTEGITIAMTRVNGA